jgi:tRNA pseudouridine55 synthase
MSAAEPTGVVVVDKPQGPTSHDVVGRVRRMLGTRRVGHAGTLDPMARGVLVILVGEATKLGPYLTAHDKGYLATVAFGSATDTLDAEGRVTRTAEVPAWLREELAALPAVGARLGEALAAEAARTEQVPPAYSAISVDGRRSYDRARAGEDVELAPRTVEVRALRILEGAAPVPAPVPVPVPDPWLVLELEVSKGYYVRSLARDLGERLGVPAHLRALARTSSGPFHVRDAVRLDAGAEALRAGLIPLADAASRALPCGRLTAEGAVRTRQGKRLSALDFVELPPLDQASAWIDPDGRLAAVGTRSAAGSATDPAVKDEHCFVMHRGFAG